MIPGEAKLVKWQIRSNCDPTRAMNRAVNRAAANHTRGPRAVLVAFVVPCAGHFPGRAFPRPATPGATPIVGFDAQEDPSGGPTDHGCPGARFLPGLAGCGM
jgi:hypothetical protein